MIILLLIKNYWIIGSFIFDKRIYYRYYYLKYKVDFGEGSWEGYVLVFSFGWELIIGFVMVSLEINRIFLLEIYIERKMMFMIIMEYDIRVRYIFILFLCFFM